MKICIQKLVNTNCTRPWMVRYYKASKPVRKFFATRKEARAYAQALKEALESEISFVALKYYNAKGIRIVLTKARSHERGMVALALFAAIRPETLERLPAECVKTSEKAIILPGWLSLSNRNTILKESAIWPGLPPILWRWLERYPFQPCDWTKLQRQLRHTLGKQWIRSGLRHTAASCYCALYGIRATSILLGHTSTHLVEKYYAGQVTRAEADEFFAIGPESIPPPADLKLG